MRRICEVRSDEWEKIRKKGTEIFERRNKIASSNARSSARYYTRYCRDTNLIILDSLFPFFFFFSFLFFSFFFLYPNVLSVYRGFFRFMADHSTFIFSWPLSPPRICLSRYFPFFLPFLWIHVARIWIPLENSDKYIRDLLLERTKKYRVYWMLTVFFIKCLLTYSVLFSMIFYLRKRSIFLYKYTKIISSLL